MMNRSLKLHIKKQLPRALILATGICISVGPRLPVVLADTLDKKELKHDAKVNSDKYFQELSRKFWRMSTVFHDQEFRAFCKENGLDCNNGKVKFEFGVARLFHELVRHGGILGNRYELVEEREKDIRKIAGNQLIPLGDDAKERYPGKMLNDMFSDKPKYMLFPDRRLFFFGDCDEFEMLYVTILRNAGLKAKVVMTMPNHVETQVWIGGKPVLVDNSFSKFGHKRKCKGKCTDYMVGACGYKDKKKAKEYIDLINKRASTKASVEVSPDAVKRVENAILSYLR